MIRHLTFTELENEFFSAELIDCARQIWKDGRVWQGFRHTPRHSIGLSILQSDIEATYTFPDGTSRTARKGDIVLIPQDQLYVVSFHGGGRGVDMHTANFLLYDREGRELRLPPQFELHPGAASPLCQTAISELADLDTLGESRLRRQAKLLELLSAVSVALQNTSGEFYAIRRGVRLLQSEWNRGERIGRYAEAAEMSESNFYLCFKAWAGVSPVQYRQNICINAARSMLQNSSLTVAEIAAATGFDDPYYFSRVFKKMVGVSPREYRKKVQVFAKPL